MKSFSQWLLIVFSSALLGFSSLINAQDTDEATLLLETMQAMDETVESIETADPELVLAALMALTSTIDVDVTQEAMQITLVNLSNAAQRNPSVTAETATNTVTTAFANLIDTATEDTSSLVQEVDYQSSEPDTDSASSTVNPEAAADVIAFIFNDADLSAEQTAELLDEVAGIIEGTTGDQDIADELAQDTIDALRDLDTAEDLVQEIITVVNETQDDNITISLAKPTAYVF